ncbi:GIY-YIG nuclease family protein [uncultured Lacticaseibacillus sp.]|uniref:GIY-YIG nuclease family protein n=1 Tax=uncultured Lacticaseibacillus sp. TaxID=2775882 RepID=UPI0025984167|nr:GIY-YIG nuclease family protein [uncultured Lacticaseibacillus sp.]
MNNMSKDERKVLVQAYKMAPTYYGVIQIENTRNHKRFIAAVPNIKGRWDYYQVNLNNHKYGDTELQRDWDAMGADAFAYSVLFKEKTDDVLNMRAELKDLLAIWREEVKPEYKS